eukprot:TRINITY_DN6472_c3_g1_i2.p1 TRINITY_DN6472_c3_g1~~TRINITY_DN6472_c3_g1_i2.p1  ORF type:complete len:181 (-),score=27.68 TRINITY_DN6472_c3_g1_i2:184-690(-)
MANASAKKILIKNRKKMKAFHIASAIIWAIYVLYRIYYHYDSMDIWNWIGSSIFFGVWITAYFLFTSRATAQFDPDTGKLIDGGDDLSKGMIMEYSWDLVYVNFMVQILTMFSNYFWLLYLSVPVYAIYKVITGVIVPYYKMKDQQDLANEERNNRKKKKPKRRTFRA